MQTLTRTLSPNGHAIIATFAIDGPSRRSGLDIVRYNAADICAEFGSEFQLTEQLDETHITPWDSQQKFSYFQFNRKKNMPL